MLKFDLPRFEKRLVRAGVAPRHVCRASAEIRDHIADLLDEAELDGLTGEQAERFTEDRLGDIETVTAAMAARTELKTWSYRYPQLARVCLPLAYVMLLPTAPIFAGVSHAPQIARWGIAMMMGAAVTAIMFLALQISIMIG
jgi:hypothetical protein